MIFTWTTNDGSASIYGSTTSVDIRFLPRFNDSITLAIGNNPVLTTLTREEAEILRTDIVAWIKGGAKGVYEIRKPTVAEAPKSRRGKSTGGGTV